MLLQRLAMAERHVAEGWEHLRRQRELISEQERDGRDTSLARDLLVTMEKSQEQHCAARDRIAEKLARLS